MKITIDLDETGCPFSRTGDPEDDGHYHGTIQYAIVSEAARQYRQEIGKEIVSEIRAEVKKAREEAVRAALTPIVEQAMGEPIRKTNTYGEPTGPETTLREMVVDEVKRYLEAPTGDRYARDRQSMAQKLVAEQVSQVVAGELKAAVDKAKGAAVGAVRDAAAEVVAKNLREKLDLPF